MGQSFNFKAFGWSAGTHALLLLLFLLWKYDLSQPVTAVTTGGFEVNLGTDENGWGDDQPEKTGKPADFRSAVQFEKEKSDALPEKIETTTDKDAPELSTKTQKPAVHAPETPEHPTPSPVAPAPPKPRYTYAGETGTGGNDAANNKPGGAQGNTSGPGDRGVPGGTPGAANYSGTPGNGSGGINHTLTGRKISPEKFDAEFHESGKVVIRVTVDRNGNIVGKHVMSSPNQELANLAMDKLNQAHFSPSTTSEPQQFGEVTILFKTH